MQNSADCRTNRARWPAPDNAVHPRHTTRAFPHALIVYRTTVIWSLARVTAV